MSLTGVLPGADYVDLVETSFAATAGPPAWVEDLRQVIAGLQQLNGTTESDFLAVGGNLVAFLTASRQLHAGIAKLTALVSGEQAQHACNSLLSARRYLGEIQRRSEEGSRALVTLQAGADRIRRGFSTFNEIASSFRTVAVLARIEVSHLASSQQNLKNLASDVLACSDEFGKRAGRVLQGAVQFNSRTTAALQQAARFEAIQMEELPSLLAAVDQDVNTFQNQQRETAKLSSMLAGELDSVTRTLGGVATSIQFHDITRQQVEHVIGALEGLLRSGSTADLSASGGALVRLQKAQLKSAAAAFAVSTAKIGSDLKGVAATVGEMAAGSNRIDGLGRQEKDSLLGGIESRFASIARAVTELHSLEHSTRATVTDLQSVSQDLGVAVSEIQSIEIQLSMISLNAVISANHIAAQGEVLIVIAGAIRELRMKSALRSSDAKAAIHSISEAVQSFQRIYTEGAAEAGDASEETFLANLNHDVGDLQSAGASNAAAAAAVAALADTLVASLQKARDHFAIGDLFAETAGRCCRLLDAVAAQAQPPGASDAALPWNLDESYTMQAERDVQRALSGELKDAPFDAGSRHLPVESEPEVEFF